VGDGCGVGGLLKLVISYDPDEHPEGHYLLSYSSLREDYLRYTMMSDEDFTADLLNILHFTCITCWMKEKRAQYLLGDTGLIHELVHLLLARDSVEFTTNTKLSTVREMFDRECCLA
jgi:hypothetical protein